MISNLLSHLVQYTSNDLFACSLEKEGRNCFTYQVILTRNAESVKTPLKYHDQFVVQ